LEGETDTEFVVVPPRPLLHLPKRKKKEKKREGGKESSVKTKKGGGQSALFRLACFQLISTRRQDQKKGKKKKIREKREARRATCRTAMRKEKSHLFKARGVHSWCASLGFL